ncbi:unnamed protein product [Prunus armeniaca]
MPPKRLPSHPCRSARAMLQTRCPILEDPRTTVRLGLCCRSSDNTKPYPNHRSRGCALAGCNLLSNGST